MLVVHREVARVRKDGETAQSEECVQLGWADAGGGQHQPDTAHEEQCGAYT